MYSEPSGKTSRATDGAHVFASTTVGETMRKKKLGEEKMHEWKPSYPTLISNDSPGEILQSFLGYIPRH